MTDRRLLDAHMRRMFALRDQVSASVLRLGKTYGFDSPDFVEGAVDVVLAGQTEEALAVWGHLSTAVALADPNDGGEIEVDAPVDVLIGAATHAGTPLETVYRRPGIRALELIGDGMDVADIFTTLSPDVAQTVASDVAMAGRNAERVYGSVDRRIVGWRRVPNIGACRWCVYIATQRYKKERLAPAHRNCHCGTEPIIGRVDPGHIIDPEGLAAIKRGGGAPKRSGARVRTPRGTKVVDVPEIPDVPATIKPGPITDRIEADRARAREILDGHKGAQIDPGPRPRLSGDIDPRDPEQMAKFRADQEEWVQRSNAAREANSKSTLRTAEGALSTEGDELLGRLEAVGSEVLTEARGRVTNLDGMIEEARRAEQIKDAAALESQAYRTGIQAEADDAVERVARSKFGRTYDELELAERREAGLLYKDEPGWLDYKRRSEEAAIRARQTREEWEALEGRAYFAERDAVLEVLREIRPTGSGSDLSFVKTARSGESKAVQDAIKESAKFYPEDWTRNLGETREIIHKKVDRGFQRDNRNGTIDIALSKEPNPKLGLGPYERVATHELAHAMESTNSRITASEWAFFKKRTAGLSSEPCWAGSSERGIRDGFPDTYFGKSYGSELDSHKELLSMSMEHAFNASGLTKGKDPLDEGHLAWLLGVWVTA